MKKHKQALVPSLLSVYLSDIGRDIYSSTLSFCFLIKLVFIISRIWAFPVFFLLLFFPATAQYTSTRYEHLTVDDGLPSPIAFAITQDQQGFIWIGTFDGLCRYDGYEFKLYKPRQDTPNCISDNIILSLCVSQDGILWIGTMNGGLNRFDPVSEQFEHFQLDSTDDTSLSENAVFSIFEDRSQNLWVGTRNGGLNRMDRSTGKFHRYQHDPADSTSISNNFIRTIFEDRNGFLWLGTHGGLNKFDPRNEQFSSYRSIEGSPNSLSLDWITSVCEDKWGMIWVGTTNGLNRLDPETGEITQFWPDESNTSTPGSLSSQRISCLILDDRQDLWIGTETGGINHYNYENEQFYSSEFNSDQPQSLINNLVNTLFQDREGTIWIGTPSGVSLLKPTLQKFKVYNHEPNNPNSLGGHNISSLYEDEKGDLWIAAQDEGLNRFDRQNNQFQNFLNSEGSLSPLGQRRVTSVIEGADGYFWVGTFGAGLFRYEQQTKKLNRYRHSPSNRNFIFSLFQDRMDVLWFGSAGGLNRFDPETEMADYFPYAPEDPTSRMASIASCVYEDRNDNLWVGTNRFGLKQFNRQTEKFEHYIHDKDNLQSLSHNSINDVLEDKQGRLWVATDGGGLNRFFPEKGTFEQYREEDGLSSDVVRNIAEDASGNLWLSTGRGLSKFDPITGNFWNFDVIDGLPSHELGPIHPSQKTGELYLASGKGLVIFHPDSILKDTKPPPVVITRLIRYNTDLVEGLPIETPAIDQKQSVRLSYKDDILTFEFAALSYLKTPKNQYAYRMEGFNDNWIQLGTKRNVSFTGLEPGNYTFHVKASNGDKIWNETGTSLKIIITPPWYWAWWSKSIYIIMAICSLHWIYRNQLSRRLAAAEAIRLRELDEIKTKLYTNITHEFRTPLTVISGMADQVLNDPKMWFRVGMQMIKRNSAQLLDLVSQMLELSKLEGGTLKVNMIQGDIVAFLRYLSESFQSYAESRNIELAFESGHSELYMDFDPDKINMIFSNLLSNAVKFTPAGGRVRLIIVDSEASNPKSITAKVEDTGIGIPTEKLPNIFDRFYQIDDASTRKAEGTGIGLALTKELINLLDGDVFVESKIGEGTIFTVVLPVTTRAPLTEEWNSEILQSVKNKSGEELTMSAPVQKISTHDPYTSQEDTEYSVLIIEDNQDVVQYLAACLKNEYRIEIAYNGLQGVEKAFETIPDLVISDVMMPEMDGFEVCNTLKRDTRTSHIPIILLTAKADLDSRLEGLERGADVYLAKPFQKAELLIRIRKLLELRVQLQQHYLALAGIKEQWLENYPSVDKEEQAFLENIRSLIESNIANPDYTIPQLCKDAGMSKSQLHRKLTALTGLSANRFMRSIRLAKAQALLKNSSLPISQIAFETGFQSPDYFGRLFQKEFGLNPSEFRKA